MGTRRRFSFEWQAFVLKKLADRCRPMFAGTSNVYYAMKLGIECFGTMAHEWLQAHQRLVGKLERFQKTAFENWFHEYQGQLGIALSDVVGFDAFLRDFDLNLSKKFAGVRHDSGDPVDWANKLLDHYRAFSIDSETKTAVFSDGLDFERAVALYDAFNSKIRTSFGIGTWLTNDMGEKAMQFVIKMVECNGRPVAKVTDSRGKETCEDGAFEAEIKRIFQKKSETGDWNCLIF